jgi:Holliday junction resolvasome RuvABC endonuclease subunit
MYLWAIDVSLASTGVAIFTKEGKPIHIFSIPTTNKVSTQERLWVIGSVLLETRRQYPTDLIVCEKGFSRFSTSTQMLYRAFGVVSYLFHDIDQVYVPPSTIKKLICGNGRADKKDVEKVVLRQWPDLTFKCDDESDACGVGLYHFVVKDILKLKG